MVNEQPDISRFNLDDSRIALGGYSPVSYVDHEVAQPGSKEHTVTSHGIRYLFTDEEQRQKFEADPDRYEPAYGGWCAFGMSVDKRFRIDPHKFLMRDGRLLVFLNDAEVDARDLWLQGSNPELRAKADDAWRRFSS
jgi:YHS domain-containing protein